ncbi:MAG TPA: hypothetical protein VK449_02195 [Anaerolineales bacterium]|nr:hypothetical protein [Anaerolineales bacterium]
MTSPSTAERRIYLILFLAGLAVFGAAAVWIAAPGYMDAEYYYATATQLATGKGLVEPFIWNFLAAPHSLPAPSHIYWQPLASVMAAAPMALFGTNFRIAQVISVLLAALVSPLAARLALLLGAERRAAWLAGVLAILPGFFLPYLVTTDTFAVFAVIGGLLWWQIGVAVVRPAGWRWMVLGALVALGSLARADGLLLWFPVVYAVAASGRPRWRHFALAVGGFVVLMLPWWLRNLAVTGAWMSPGSIRTLWLLNYDELFSFPASQLTFARWWHAGLTALLQARLAAAWVNLQSLVAVSGLVLLLPLAAVSAWRHRAAASVRAGALYSAVLYLFMSVVFPFAGSRGGFFHSSAALIPLVSALAGEGTLLAAEWMASRLKWAPERTRAMLTSIAVVLAAALSLWTLAGKAGAFGPGGSFGRNLATYRAAERVLASQDGSASVVAVGDPPGYFLAGGHRAVVIPNGTEQVLRQVSETYGVDWIVLEADHPAGLDALYEDPGARDWLAEPLVVVDPNGLPVYLYRVLKQATS